MVKLPINLIDLQKEGLLFKELVLYKLSSIIDSAEFILGKDVKAFEMAFSEYIGMNHGIGMKSGTAALQLGMLALGIGEGDEVITTPMTFNATVESIVNTGATPVFCDTREDGIINELLLEGCITKKTKAILGVHLYGKSCNNYAITTLCRKYGIFYIEDACQAHGSEDAGKKLGSFGDIACFSFMPAKVLGAYGDAGMVLTHNPSIAEKCYGLRDHGREAKYLHTSLGFNERIDTIQAAILGIKLGSINEFIKKRRVVAKRYFDQLHFQSFFSVDELNSINFYVYPLKVTLRDEFIKKLYDKGIKTGVYYPIPCHLQPVFSYLGYKKGDFPIAEKIAEINVAIPMNPYLEDDEVEYIINEVNKLDEHAY